MKYLAPNGNGLTRKKDAKGEGHYGASRGSRKHMGIDFVTVPGQNIIAPISGKVTKLPYAASDLVHRGIEIKNGNEMHQLFYVIPLVKVGQMVKKGQIIAKADSLLSKYGASMTNHVHHEVEVNGKFINPTSLYEKIS